MFAKLKGNLDAIYNDSVIIDVSGVGYLVHVSSCILNKLNVNQEIIFLLETKFQTDMIILYGFLDESQKFIFNYLNNITGIGNKTALTLSGFFNIESFINLKDNPNVLKPTVCTEKVFEKILFAIRGDKNFYKKFSHFNLSEKKIENFNLNHFNDALNAMISIGINKKKSEEILTKIFSEEENLELEEIIKKALSCYSK